jgi:hypothetical protein
MAKGGRKQPRRKPVKAKPAEVRRPAASASQSADALSGSWLSTMTSRRNLLMGGGALAVALAGEFLLWPKEPDEESTLQILPDSEIKIKWRDVFDLQISDAKLKHHVTGFMDIFEKAVFKFYLQDPKTGVVSENYITGQQILADIQKTNQEYERTGFRYNPAVQHWIPNGKIVMPVTTDPSQGVFKTVPIQCLLSMMVKNLLFGLI